MGERGGFSGSRVFDSVCGRFDLFTQRNANTLQESLRCRIESSSQRWDQFVGNSLCYVCGGENCIGDMTVQFGELYPFG